MYPWRTGTGKTRRVHTAVRGGAWASGILALALVLESCAAERTSTESSGPPSSSTAGRAAATATGSVPAAAQIPPTNAGGHASPLPACAGAQITVHALTGQGAMGRFSFTVALTNIGGHGCSLYGFPSVTGLTASGRPYQATDTTVYLIGVQAPVGAPIPTTVTLAPGAHAFVVLVFTDVPRGGATTCPQITRLQLTPPEAGETYTLPALQQGKPMSDCEGIFVSPILSGADLTGRGPFT